MKTKEFSVRIDPRLAEWVKSQGFSASELVMRIAAAGYHGKLNLAVPDPGAGSERVTVRLAPCALSAIREMTGSRQSLIALRRTIAAGASARLLPPAPAPAPKIPAPRAQPGQIEREEVRPVYPLPESHQGAFPRDPEPVHPEILNGFSLLYPGCAGAGLPERSLESESPWWQLWAGLLREPAFYVLIACLIYGLYKWLFAAGSTVGTVAAVTAAPVATDVPWNPQVFSEIAKGVWQ